MPLVNVMVNSRAYTIACDDGEEGHLKELAAHVDEKVRELAGTVGQVGDQKLLLMAAVLITDELFDARGRLDGHAKKAKDLASAHADLDARVAAAERRAADAEKRAADAAEETKRLSARTADEAGRNVQQALDDADARAASALDAAAERLERIAETLKAA
jgi:cell division protein ZapA